jgi:hypothetical protein
MGVYIAPYILNLKKFVIVSGQLHVPAILLSRKEARVPTECEAEFGYSEKRKIFCL